MNRAGIIRAALLPQMSGAAIKRYCAPAIVVIAMMLGFNGQASAQVSSQQLSSQQLQVQVQQLQQLVKQIHDDNLSHLQKTQLLEKKLAAVRAAIAKDPNPTWLSKRIGQALE